MASNESQVANEPRQSQCGADACAVWCSGPCSRQPQPATLTCICAAPAAPLSPGLQLQRQAWAPPRARVLARAQKPHTECMWFGLFGMEIANHYCGFGKKASLAKEQQTWVGSRKKYTSMHENFGLKARAQSGNSKLDCTGPWRRAQGKNAYTLMAFPGKPSPGKTARSWLVQQDKPISILIQMLQTSVNQSPCQMPSQCRWQWRWQKARMLKSLAHSRSRRFVARTRRLLLRLDI